MIDSIGGERQRPCEDYKLVVDDESDDVVVVENLLESLAASIAALLDSIQIRHFPTPAGEQKAAE